MEAHAHVLCKREEDMVDVCALRKAELYAFILREEHVIIPDICKEMEWARGSSEMVYLECPNTIIAGGISECLSVILQELVNEEGVTLKRCEPCRYIIPHGAELSYPIAYGLLPIGGFGAKHWCPMVFTSKEFDDMCKSFKIARRNPKSVGGQSLSIFQM